MKKLCTYAVLGMLVLSCSKKTETHFNDENGLNELLSVDACAPVAEMINLSPPVIKDNEVAERESVKNTTKKIIKDGTISISVSDINAAKRHVDSTLKQFKAYYEEEQYNNYNDAASYELKIRVPCDQFENLLRTTETGTGKITAKTINTRDVTAEYTDTEVRLNSKKLFRERYRQLLAKAGKVADVLLIEENILKLQEEIESNEGQIKLFDDQISYSTLDVRLYKPVEEKEKPKEETFLQKLKLSLNGGWESVIIAVLWIIKQWPLAIVILISAVLVVKRWRRRSTNS